VAKIINNQTSDARWISDLVGVFTDPIIVMPGGWDETLPDWIKKAITLERLLENARQIQGPEMTATDAEAVAYLYTASLTAPLNNVWTQIYLFLAGKVMAQHQKTEISVDIKVESLSDYQQSELKRFKKWLYETRVQSRKDNMKTERKKLKEENRPKEIAQSPLFDF
jgi:hypothetical protein